MDSHTIDLLMGQSCGRKGLSCCSVCSSFKLALKRRPHVVSSRLGGLDITVLPLPKKRFCRCKADHRLVSSALTMRGLMGSRQRVVRGGMGPRPTVFIRGTRMNCRLASRGSRV